MKPLLVARVEFRYIQKKGELKMQMSSLLRDEKGQAEAVNLQLTLIIALVVAVIVVYQLFIAGAGPTDCTTDDDYDADALAAYNNVIALSWAGIGLMSVAIIILAASVILGVIRGFGGAGRGV